MKNTFLSNISTDANLERLAKLFDSRWSIPIIGVKFGVDSLLGLLPVGGDIAGLVLSSSIVIGAAKLGAPRVTLIQMLGNILVDSLVGVIPFVGDIADVFFRANLRNMELLRNAKREPVDTATARRNLLFSVVTLCVLALLSLIVGVGLAGYGLIKLITYLFGEGVVS